MNELLETSQKQVNEISIRMVMSAGDDFIQTLSIEDLDGAQNLMDWFRDPKQGPVWTWLVPSVRKIHMLHRIHIMGIDIDGYIEPDNYKIRWYHRAIDRFRVWYIGRSAFSKKVTRKKEGIRCFSEENS